MPKPSITKRLVKGSALTYAEQDANFQNLADATITITAGTGGTAVTADLNGNITLVAGTGITFTGNNTTKTITVNSTGGLQNVEEDTSPTLGGALDTAGYTIQNGSGSKINFSVYGGGVVNLTATGNNIAIGDTTTGGSGYFAILSNIQPTIQIGTSSNLSIVGANTSAPSNTSTPVAWMQISVNGSLYKLPLYQ